MWCKGGLASPTGDLESLGFHTGDTAPLGSRDGILSSLGSHTRVPSPLMSQTGAPSSLGSPASWHKCSSANDSHPSLCLPSKSISRESRNVPAGIYPLPGAGGSVRADATLCHRLISLPSIRSSSSAPAVTGPLNHRPCSPLGLMPRLFSSPNSHPPAAAPQGPRRGRAGTAGLRAGP